MSHDVRMFLSAAGLAAIVFALMAASVITSFMAFERGMWRGILVAMTWLSLAVGTIAVVIDRAEHPQPKPAAEAAP